MDAAGSQEYWMQLEEMFHRASELPEAERAAWVQSACRENGSMQAELLELLASDQSVRSLLASEAPPPTDGLLRKDLGAALTHSWLGRTVGDFQLEAVLGRGGMGTVYLARRTHGDFVQSVAVKLINRHLSSGPAVAQFGRERDVLARMMHRHVAQLVDAGTIDGMPWVAMEYIEGRRFDEVCDDPDLSLESKLRLMVQLCDAVSYVHRNLILHRDLKPDNVMLSSDGVLKLLDFGTVKLLGDAAEISSEMTQAGLRPMALRYASPERIQGKNNATTADVYSLGMMLYRLVAGRLPAEIEAATLAEHIQRLHDRQLAPPSDRSFTPLEKLPRNAKDLDAIVMKTIRFEPEQRYPSADALAADLKRYLTQQPVQARQGTLRYLAARFYQRNLGVVRTASGVLIVLAAGAVVMRHQAKLASQEQHRAQAGIEEERKLAHLLLFDYFDELREIPGSTDAQRKAATQAIVYLDGLMHVTDEPEFQLDSLQAYRRMGLLLGSPYEANLGDAPTAIQTLDRALPLSKRLLDSSPRNLDYRVAFIGLQTAIAQDYFSLKRPEQALEHLLSAKDLASETADDPRVTEKMLIQCAALYKTLADAYGQHANTATEDLDKQLQALEQSGNLYQAAHQARGSTIVLMTIGILLEDVDANQAIAAYQKGLNTIASLPNAERTKVGMVRLNATLQTKLACVYLRSGRMAEAEALIEPERIRARRAVAADPIDTRARDDLIAVDSDVLDATSDVANFEGAAELLHEYLATAEFLTHAHPEDASWQFNDADALLRSAAFEAKHGDATASRRHYSEGLPKLLALANQPDADATTLDLAAEALLAANAGPLRNLPLAVTFAERAVGGSHPPGVDQFLALEEAQEVSHMPAAQKSARAALALLAAHPGSVENALKVKKARQLMSAGGHPSGLSM
jgi:tetratricopeptide (TPR) repeat protein